MRINSAKALAALRVMEKHGLAEHQKQERQEPRYYLSKEESERIIEKLKKPRKQPPFGFAARRMKLKG